MKARALVGGMVFIAVLVVGWGFVQRDSVGGAPSIGATTSSAATTATPPAQLNDTDAQTIETALNSGDPEQVRVVLEPSIAAAYDVDPTPLLPPGTVVDIDPASFQLGRDDAATVDAFVGGASPRSWTLILVLRGDSWLLVSTVEK